MATPAQRKNLFVRCFTAISLVFALSVVYRNFMRLEDYNHELDLRVLQESEVATSLELEKRKKTSDVCEGYNGVLHIQHGGDAGAAAATVFFVYMVNHLLYAEANNLLPWIHLDNVNHRVYDDKVHGEPQESLDPAIAFKAVRGIIPNQPALYDCDAKPATPLWNDDFSSTRRMSDMTVRGNGMWKTYFDPVSVFDPLENPCKSNVPIFALDYAQVADGLHHCFPEFARSWAYGDVRNVPTPEKLNQTWQEWYRPMRLKGARMVHRYFRLQPWLQERVDEANPLPKHPATNTTTCLAMHVRKTDKELSGGRRELKLSKYKRFAEAYVKHQKMYGTRPVIYLATDSRQVVEEMRDTWPNEIAQHVRIQKDTLRSKNETPTFDLVGNRHHRTNTEVLVDIYSMAKCSWFLHGRSSVSEAVHYLNPKLIVRGSIDLEDEDRVKVKQFKNMLLQQDDA